MAGQEIVDTVLLDPRERKDWTFDWTDRLPPQDTIVGLKPAVTYYGTLDDASSAISIADSQFTEYDTTLWFEDIQLDNQIAGTAIVTTALGRILVASILIIARLN